MKALVVNDLGFGDSGKGTVVDYLVREHNARAVIRYNGGSQAAHHVVTDDGREHTFSQLGSGSFVPGVETYLSKFMLVNPFNLLREWNSLRQQTPIKLTDVWIDEDALIITPLHRTANRLREVQRGVGRHGSCGEGIGETQSLANEGFRLRMGDLRPNNVRRVTGFLRILQERYAEEFKDLKDHPEYALLQDLHLPIVAADTYLRFARLVSVDNGCHLKDILRDTVVFEGAQGVLLDENWGFNPYTTWSTTTPHNASVLLGGDYRGEIDIYGVLRAYFTRHGAGPFPTEDRELRLPDGENIHNDWQGAFRVGHFDFVLAQYGLRLAQQYGNVKLTITCLDRIATQNLKFCTHYQVGTTDRLKHRITAPNTEMIETVIPQYVPAPKTETEYLASISNVLDLPVSLVSRGRTAADKEVLQ